MRYRDIAQASPRKPISPTGTIKPMTPDQSRHEAERKADINQDIRDEQAQCSRKIQGLRAKLARKP
jgi:hypothetical protein